MSSMFSHLSSEMQTPDHWLKLSESQSNLATQIEILSQGLEVIPHSLDLWKSYIYKIQGTPQFQLKLEHAINLFPHETSFWDLQLSLFPSINAYERALSCLDASIIWPAFLQFCESLFGTSLEYEIPRIYSVYLQSHNDELDTVLGRLLSHGLGDAAGHVLMSIQCTDQHKWERVLSHQVNDSAIWEFCLSVFPTLDAELVPKIAMSRGIDGRSIILHGLQTPSSLESFVKIYKSAAEWYETCIESLISKHNGGTFDVSKYLHEYANIIEKRSGLLANALVKFKTQDGRSWVYKSRVFSRPQYAASILEEGISIVDVKCGTHLADLYTEYAKILEANGSDKKNIYDFLQSAINNPNINMNEKPPMAIELVRIQSRESPASAVETMKKIMRSDAFAFNSDVWYECLHLFSTVDRNLTLEAFNRCCINRAITMKTLIHCALSFPRKSANQVLIFERGCELFKLPLGLPVWKEYLKQSRSPELFSKALLLTRQPKVVLDLCSLIKTEIDDMFHKRRLYNIVLQVCPTFDVWHEFIGTYPDAVEKREVYEQAIKLLNNEDRIKMAEKYLEYEDQFVNNTERVNALRMYLNTLKQDTLPVKPMEVEFVAETE